MNSRWTDLDQHQCFTWNVDGENSTVQDLMVIHRICTFDFFWGYLLISSERTAEISDEFAQISTTEHTKRVRMVPHEQ